MNNYKLLLGLLLFLTACTCDETDLLINDNPDLFLVKTELAEEHLLIRFNNPVDTATVTPGKTLLLQGAEIDFQGVRQWWADTILTIAYCDINCLSDNCEVTLTLKSTEAGESVRDLEGRRLDGDKDGFAGGDFVRSMLVPGCGQEPVIPPVVITPEANQFGSDDYSLSQDGHFSVAIHFGQAIDPATVIVDSTIILAVTTNNDLRLNGLLDWSGDTSVVFTTEQKVEDFCVYDPDCRLRLTLKSDPEPGLPAVLSREGVALDGDENGLAGGDYSTQFSIEPPPPPPAVPPVVLRPAAGEAGADEFILTVDNRISFEVLFSRPIATATVQPGISVILSVPNTDEMVTGAVSWTSDSSFTFQSADPIGEYCLWDAGFRLNFTLTDAVTGADGVALDGDNDGQAGGDFQTQFVLDISGDDPPFVTETTTGAFPWTVEFSQPMDKSSAVSMASVLFTPADLSIGNVDQVLPVDLYWSPDGRILYLTFNYVTTDPSQYFYDKITLVGACDGLRAVNGLPLDGDEDGMPGGNYSFGECYKPPQATSLAGYWQALCATDYDPVQRYENNDGFSFQVSFFPFEMDRSTVFVGANSLRFGIYDGAVFQEEITGEIVWLDEYTLEFRSEILPDLCEGVGECCVGVYISSLVRGRLCDSYIDGNFDGIEGGPFIGTFRLPAP